MTTSLRTLPSAPRAPAVTPVLRRACACGGTPGPTGECEACRQKRLAVQRSARSAAPCVAPPAVHDVLRSSGASLDEGTRAEMEPRFRHSFADVRVHADGRAAESARAVGAHAYAVGPHLVFGAGRYAPGSAEGRRLLAHELAHVVQQHGAPGPPIHPRLEIGAADDPLEREAEASAAAVVSSSTSTACPAGNRRAELRMLRRTPAEPVSADQPAAVAAMVGMKKKLDHGRYGCFCGVGECEDKKTINDLDECCKDHDMKYNEHFLTGGKPGPGEISMWSREGFLLSREADRVLVRCAIRSRSDPRTMDLAGRATRALAVVLYSLRAAYASRLQSNDARVSSER